MFKYLLAGLKDGHVFELKQSIINDLNECGFAVIPTEKVKVLNIYFSQHYRISRNGKSYPNKDSIDSYGTMTIETYYENGGVYKVVELFTV